MPKPLEEDTGEEASMPDGQMAAVRVTGARLLFSLEPGHIPLSLSAQLPAGAACMPSACQLTPGGHFLWPLNGMFADSLHRRGFYLGTRPASQSSLWLPVWSGHCSCRAHPRAPLCSLRIKVMDAEDAEGPSATAKLGPRSSGVQGGMRKAWPPLRGNPECVCGQSAATPFPELGRAFASGQGHLP